MQQIENMDVQEIKEEVDLSGDEYDLQEIACNRQNLKDETVSLTSDEEEDPVWKYAITSIYGCAKSECRYFEDNSIVVLRKGAITIISTDIHEVDAALKRVKGNKGRKSLKRPLQTNESSRTIPKFKQAKTVESMRNISRVSDGLPVGALSNPFATRNHLPPPFVSNITSSFASSLTSPFTSGLSSPFIPSPPSTFDHQDTSLSFAHQYPERGMSRNDAPSPSTLSVHQPFQDAFGSKNFAWVALHSENARNFLDCNKSESPPKKSADCNKSKSPPEKSADCNKSKSPPEKSVDCNPKSPPEKSADCNKSKSPPEKSEDCNPSEGHQDPVTADLISNETPAPTEPVVVKKNLMHKLIEDFRNYLKSSCAADMSAKIISRHAQYLSKLVHLGNTFEKFLDEGCMFKFFAGKIELPNGNGEKKWKIGYAKMFLVSVKKFYRYLTTPNFYEFYCENKKLFAESHNEIQAKATGLVDSTQNWALFFEGKKEKKNSKKSLSLTCREKAKLLRGKAYQRAMNLTKGNTTKSDDEFSEMRDYLMMNIFLKNGLQTDVITNMLVTNFSEAENVGKKQFAIKVESCQKNCQAKIVNAFITNEVHRMLQVYVAMRNERVKRKEHEHLFVTGSGQPFDAIEVTSHLRSLATKLGVNEDKIQPKRKKNINSHENENSEDELNFLVDEQSSTKELENCWISQKKDDTINSSEIYQKSAKNDINSSKCDQVAPEDQIDSSKPNEVPSQMIGSSKPASEVELNQLLVSCSKIDMQATGQQKANNNLPTRLKAKLLEENGGQNNAVGENISNDSNPLVELFNNDSLDSFTDLSSNSFIGFSDEDVGRL